VGYHHLPSYTTHQEKTSVIGRAKMVLDYFFFVHILASLSKFAHATSFPRRYPAKATGLTTIYAPDGVQIRYKEPHICETTPGVRSYSGYVDLNATTHMYVPFHHRFKPIAANWRNLFGLSVLNSEPEAEFGMSSHFEKMSWSSN
jgi:hypothetical protein